MSRPLESEAYRNVRSPSRGNGDRMVATRVFSGLISSDCAFANAAARTPMVSLELCMTRLRGENIKANRAGS